MKYFLSVIVPVYKGESFVRKNLEQYKVSLTKLKKTVIRDFEIIAVIDGSPDNSEQEAKKVKGIKVISYKENMGKGHALKVGFYNSKGDVITFIDSDGDLPPNQLSNLFPYLSTADIVVASKRHPFSLVEYPLIRKILSIGYVILSKIILGISLRDTQSGLKLIKRELLDVIMPLLVVKKYAFDLELCFIAQKHGFRAVESPIHINFQGKSTIKGSSIVAMFIDLLAIRYRYSFLHYYQHEFHKVKFLSTNK
ncbi:MAG: glycosyltransferase [Spirochaetes bacterium]|nr:glycosyltransferase [Spirochaetota bacterium]